MDFKELINEDVCNVFMNDEEFSDIHLVDGKEMSVMIDEYEHVERSKSKYGDGLHTRQKLIYLKANEYGRLPSIGKQLNLDGKVYKITDATDEGGLYSITLEAITSANGRIR
ncbi:hypothetical protein ACQPUL_08425 [Clostridium butyricum]|uniref:hypothetical protein n=1 Tax=Clostridium butyricum TaxID=1492 RepID=UPI003D342167